MGAQGCTLVGSYSWNYLVLVLELEQESAVVLDLVDELVFVMTAVAAIGVAAHLAGPRLVEHPEELVYVFCVDFSLGFLLPLQLDVGLTLR